MTKTKKKAGRPKMAAHNRRVNLNTMVAPETRKWLETASKELETSLGGVIDQLVKES